MALSTIWTDQTSPQVSAGAVTPGNQIVSFVGDFQGWVWIEASFDAGTTWIEVPNSKRNHATIFGMICPDTTVQYRFACSALQGTVNCEMGP